MLFRKRIRDCRRDSETDTADTDDDCTWHGLGKMEYSSKVLPHALMHTTEQYIRGGHLQAFCTFAVEQGHKRFIKYAGTASRVYASVNVTQDGMLKCVNERILFEDVVSLLPHEEIANGWTLYEVLEMPSYDVDSFSEFVSAFSYCCCPLV